MITNPDPSDVDWLARTWMEACNWAEQRASWKLTQSWADIDTLQQLANAPVMQYDENAPKLLGIAIGRMLARELEPIDWAIISDEYGRDITLRVGTTSVVINIFDIVEKRWKSGSIDVRSIVEIAKDAVSRLAYQAD